MQDHTSQDRTLWKLMKMLQKEEMMNTKDVKCRGFNMVYKELYIAHDLIMRQ